VRTMGRRISGRMKCGPTWGLKPCCFSSVLRVNGVPKISSIHFEMSRLDSFCMGTRVAKY
jgi:hypothetical protein